MMTIKTKNMTYSNLVTYDELTAEMKSEVKTYKGTLDVYNNSQLLEYYNNKYGYNYSINDLLFTQDSPRFLGMVLNDDNTITLISKDMKVECEVEYL